MADTMFISTRDEDSSVIKNLITFGLFFLSLQMFSLSIGAQGVSANYVYIFFPVFFWFAGIKRRIVSRPQFLQVLFVFSFIYLLGLLGDVKDFFEIRRLTSFLAFIFPLLLCFIEFKPIDIRMFKQAVMLSCVYYCVHTFLIFISVWGSAGLFDLKGILGSQRYGFILCFGFFIALFDKKLFFKNGVFLQRVVICSIILLGTILTFSRSAIVGLIGGVVFFLFSILFKREKKIIKSIDHKRKKNKYIYIIASVFLIILSFNFFQKYFNINLLQFYQINFVDPLLDARLLESALEKDEESSEGFRYYVLTRIIEYLQTHPIFGSSYRGLYLLYDEFKDGASTHNQYTDIFLRTGLLGGIVWLYLLYRIYRFTSGDKGLQVGLFAIIAYGFFHETFKESQGSFIFGMLLSFSYMSVNLKKENPLAARVNLNYS